MPREYVVLKDYIGLLSQGQKVYGTPDGAMVVVKIGDHTTPVPKAYLGSPAPTANQPTIADLGPSLSAQEQESLDDMLSGGHKSFSPISEMSPETPDSVNKPKTTKLKDDEFLLSTVTGGSLPKDGKDVVLTAFPKGTWNEDQEKDIPDVDPMFKWDADLLKKMWLAHKLNENMLLSGFPGTGKTSAVRQFAAIIRQPMMKFNGKDGMEASSFLGNLWMGPQKKGMEWKDGLMPIAVRAGYLVTIDEIFKIPPGIGMALQELYEEDGYLRLDENPDPKTKIVEKHPNLRLFMTDNVKGTGDNFDKFSTTQVQDTSTLDRFGITATVGYMEHGDEVAMLVKRFPNVPKNNVTQLVRFAGLVRNGYEQNSLDLTMSPRGLMASCKLIAEGVSVRDAIDMTFIEKLGEDDQTQAARDLRDTVL